jgi:hypothetical protein
MTETRTPTIEEELREVEREIESMERELAERKATTNRSREALAAPVVRSRWQTGSRS